MSTVIAAPKATEPQLLMLHKIMELVGETRDVATIDHDRARLANIVERTDTPFQRGRADIAWTPNAMGTTNG